MRYVPTQDKVHCSCDPNYCLGLFAGTNSGNYWGIKKRNDYAEVFFDKSYYITNYTLYAAGGDFNPKKILVQGILPNKNLVDIDIITSSLLQKPYSKQTRKINYNKMLSGARFTFADTWVVMNSDWYSGLLRIDVDVSTNIVSNKVESSHKTSIIKKWNLVLIAMIYS